MTDLLVRIMQLPLRLQQGIAWAALLIVICGLALIGASSWTLVSEARQRISSAEFELSRNDFLIKQAAQSAPGAATSSAINALIFPAATEAATQADLQKLAVDAASATGVQFEAVSPQQTVTEQSVQLVGIQITFKGELPAVLQTLSALEGNTPPILIRKLTLRSIEGSKILHGEAALFAMTSKDSALVPGAAQ